MATLFSVSDMLKVAIREEETGATYYRELADTTDSEDLAKFATNVARMEDVHAERFREMLSEVGDRPPRQSYDGEYEAYMEYLLAGRIFPPGEDGVALARQQASEREAVETAMRLERSTLLFYHEAMSLVPEAHRDMLNDIIAEERQHLIQFAQYRDKHWGAD